jgi:ABC-type polysaccharide/polyol phosphate export permease
VKINPVTQVSDTVRALLLGSPHPATARSLLWIAGILAVFAPTAVLTYRRRA